MEEVQATGIRDKPHRYSLTLGGLEAARARTLGRLCLSQSAYAHGARPSAAR